MLSPLQQNDGCEDTGFFLWTITDIRLAEQELAAARALPRHIG